MFKRYFIAFLLCIPALVCTAQGEKHAQELFDLLRAGKGDSVYVRLNDDLKEKLNPTMFNDTFGMLEKQVGAYRERGDWKQDIVSGVNIYYCDVQFEIAPLRFLTAFDADGKVNSLRFVPVPSPTSSAEKTIRNDEKVIEQPITVVSGKFSLPGMLTLPKGKQQIPLVILVHGSGPQDMDETVGPNKPFLELSWGLAEQGIASIRYDKRTKVYGANFASGGGTYDEETVDDALAAIELAKTIQGVNVHEIYIIGHSLGAMLAPRIAERSNGLAGIILLAGNARPFEDLLIEQLEYVFSLRNTSDEIKTYLETVKLEVANLKKLGTDDFDEKTPLPFNSPRSYWEFSQTYKQVEVAKNLSLPIFILQGERDYQVTMEDFDIWKTSLSGKPNASFKSYSTLNHLFHEGEGKATPSEYELQKNIPTYVITDIAEWIKSKKQE